jgi:hypothetical protein
MTDDPSAYPDRSTLGYLHRIENTAKRYNPPAKILQSGQEYDLSGVRFYRVDYQFSEPDLLYNTVVTGQIRACELSFQMAARTKEEIDKFVHSVRSVKIVGERP